ncbi:protein S-acyltransferase 23 [Pyrus ussuriensis x Pyrus communis]|uniref:S-acyltransferase n=1 Tax=Pyrus ussuriensis x Pyrus communis TaxID=2448454 RepID=A0A5N5FUQ5_9ROSA|nr:protein S-acyltransferase 23 [Pyrus ussuriensis x Pyrus communis]
MFVFLTHLLLSLVPRFSSAPSFLAQLALSALLLLFFVVFGGWCKSSLLKRRASAPAFVFFNVLFVWGFYILVTRQAVPLLNNAVFSCEVVFLIIDLYSIITSDPGFVTNGFASSGSGLGTRVRYCRSCKAYIKGFDHHCPAFGNCTGQKNHPLFLILLFGLISTEASYLVCASLFAAKSGILRKPSLEVVFVIWHIYCVCFNIRTDEWINWKNYPEFQRVVQPHPGKNFTSTRFRNPYDKDILQNVREFLALRA